MACCACCAGRRSGGGARQRGPVLGELGGPGCPAEACPCPPGEVAAACKGLEATVTTGAQSLQEWAVHALCACKLQSGCTAARQRFRARQRCPEAGCPAPQLACMVLACARPAARPAGRHPPPNSSSSRQAQGLMPRPHPPPPAAGARPHANVPRRGRRVRGVQGARPGHCLGWGQGRQPAPLLAWGSCKGRGLFTAWQLSRVCGA